MWKAKLQQLAISVGAGRATLPYPFAPHPPAPGFRGLPSLDGERCVGCGACLSVCPARLFDLTISGTQLTLAAELSRCTYCGRCADICPTGAIAMTGRFETAVTSPAQLRLTAQLEMAHCPSCGRPLGTTRHLAAHAAAIARTADPDLMALCAVCKRRRSSARLKGGPRRG